MKRKIVYGGRAVYGSPFRVDWHNKEAVIEYAKKLGKGQVVIKVPGRQNYNITFASRADTYEPEWIVYRVT